MVILERVTVAPTLLQADHTRVFSGVLGRSPIYVQYRTQLTSGFLEYYIKESNKLDGHAVKYCGSSFYRYECLDCGESQLVAIGCKHRNFCPKCAANYTNMKVNHAYDSVFKHFARVKSSYLIQIVFTCPWEYRDEVVRNPSRFFKVVYRTLSCYLPEWEKNGGVAGIHYIGDKNPFGLHPHIHVLMPNFVFSKKGDGIRYFKRKRPYFNLKKLRKEYSEQFEGEYHEKYDEMNVYVNYVKMTDEAKVKHKLRYAFKKPIEFYAPIIEKLGSDIKDEELAFIFKILNLEGKSYRYFGYLADGVKSRYLGYLGIEYMHFKEWIELPLLCKECGGQMMQHLDKVIWWMLEPYDEYVKRVGLVP